MKDKAARGEYVFQQDLYQAHVAKKTVNLLKVSEVQFWVKDLWPSNSPDRNPLDHCFWVQIETKESVRHHNSVTALNEDVKKAVRYPEMAEVTHVVSKFGKQWKTPLWSKMATLS